jgi:hypothetical protein
MRGSAKQNTHLHAVDLAAPINHADDLNAHVVWLLAAQAKALHPAAHQIMATFGSSCHFSQFTAEVACPGGFTLHHDL